jgi:MoaA/NifB/PqqE/SkfB family radical SAM enzyme
MDDGFPRPIPSAGEAAYEAERHACLALSVDKNVNYARYLASRALGDRAAVDYLPVKLDIENVSRCNFACTMCAVSTWHKGKRAEDMPLAQFKRLIDEQVGLVEIKLNGLGEALMQGDVYFDMIRYARERRIWVRMTTNASLLHLRDNYKKLVDSGVNEIDISIDGADAATFEAIRVQGNFKQVVANCELLNDYCEERGVTRTKMWTLVQMDNCHRLGAHVDLAADLGFKHLIFSTQLHGWGNAEMERANKAKQVSLGRGAARQLIQQGEALGVRVAFWDVAAKFDREHKCPWPFSRAVVTSDLRNVPCCMIGDPDAYEIGKGQSLLEAWKSEEYSAFRQAHIEGRVPDVCKACYKDE